MLKKLNFCLENLFTRLLTPLFDFVWFLLDSSILRLLRLLRESTCLFDLFLLLFIGYTKDRQNFYANPLKCQSARDSGSRYRVDFVEQLQTELPVNVVWIHWKFSIIVSFSFPHCSLYWFKFILRRIRTQYTILLLSKQTVAFIFMSLWFLYMYSIMLSNSLGQFDRVSVTEVKCPIKVPLVS